MPHRRIDDPKPEAVRALPPEMKMLYSLIDRHFPLLQSLDWTSRGRALEEFDKRTKACAPGGDT